MSVSTLQQAVSYLFPGGVVTQTFGTPEGGTGHEEGVDIGLPAGAPVDLVASGKYLGQAANGYVDVFSNDVTGAIDYYQHIVSAQGLQIGKEYAYQTQIGTVASVAETAPGYFTTGPHLEFGIASSAPVPGAQFPSWASIDPTNELISSANGLVNDVIGSDSGLNLTTNTTKTPTQQIQSQNTPSVGPAQAAQAALGTVLQLPTIGGVSIGGTLALVGLGVLGIVLVFALVKGGNSQ